MINTFNRGMYTTLCKYLFDKRAKVILFSNNITGRIILNTLKLFNTEFSYLLDPGYEVNCPEITNGDMIINLCCPLTPFQRQTMMLYKHYYNPSGQVAQ